MGKEIFAIRVVGCTELFSVEPLENLAVRVSIVDEKSGSLLEKSKKKRPIFSQYEKTQVIPPCQTRGISCNRSMSLTSIWNETFLFNEPIDSILQSNVVIMFELIDCSLHKGRHSFLPVAWAFLKTQYSNKKLSIVNKRSVLQLFKYPADFKYQINGYRVPAVELLHKKEVIDSRLTVEVIERSKIPIEEVECRPKNVFQKEVGATTVDELLDSGNENLDSDARKEFSTSKLYTRKCTVPKILCSQIPAGENGATCLRFNHEGTILAAAVQIDNQYNIQFYARQNNALDAPIQLLQSFPAHLDIIHELAFSSDDRYLLSVSSDGMAKIWLTDGTQKPEVVLPHTNYIYSGKFHPLDDKIIATAGYEGTIKIWDRTTEKCLLTLAQHKTRINSLVFSPNGKQMFCGDAYGCISVWDVDLHNHEITKISLQKFVVEGEIKGCCITHLDMGKSNLSLLVYTQDSIVRNFETKVMVPSQRYVGALSSKFKMECIFSPDGSYVMAGSENGGVMLWTVKGSDPVPVIEWSHKFSYPVTTIAWNPSEDMVAFSSFGSGQPILIYTDRPVSQLKKKRPLLSRGTTRNTSYISQNTSRSTSKTFPTSSKSNL